MHSSRLCWEPRRVWRADMQTAQQINDAQLTQADIERITGVPSDQYIRQRNRLRKLGIKCDTNARREVVCFWSWVAAAALPEQSPGRYIQPSPANDEPEDIGMNLGALSCGKTSKA